MYLSSFQIMQKLYSKQNKCASICVEKIVFQQQKKYHHTEGDYRKREQFYQE